MQPCSIITLNPTSPAADATGLVPLLHAIAGAACPPAPHHPRCTAACPPPARAPVAATGTTAADNADLQRCLNGDPDAFSGLVARHQQRIAAMMWRFSRDPQTHAELVQDVFVEGYRSLAGYRGTAPFEHWLCRIATRVGYRHWKQQARDRRNPTVPIEEWCHLADDAQDRLSASEAAELLHRLLAALPPRDRLVMTLRYLEDHDVAETGRLTGWSETMVRVQTWRARRKLRRLIQEYDQ